MALISLWGVPPGAVLTLVGLLVLLVPAARRGRRPGVLWTGATLVGLVRLVSGAGTGATGFRPATLVGAGPLVSVAAGLLYAALLYGVVHIESRDRPVPARLGVVAAMAGVSIAGLFAETLSGFLSVLVLAQLVALGVRLSSHGRSGEGKISGRVISALSFACVLGSASLLFVGWNQRRLAGGADLHDWIGTPFSGDAPSGLLFCGLALPVFLPGIVGGFSYGFLRRSSGGSEGFVSGGFGLPSLCVAALLLGGLQVQFSGAEALGGWGVAGVGMALVAGGFAGWLRPGTAGASTSPSEPPSISPVKNAESSGSAPQISGDAARESPDNSPLEDSSASPAASMSTMSETGRDHRLARPPSEKRLAALVQATVGLIVVGSSAASEESSEAAFGYGVIAALPALAGLAIASARLSHERDRHRGIGPKGMGYIFPSTMIFSGLLAASLLSFPWTLGFLARSQGLGALVLADLEPAAITAVALGALLALFVVFPWLRGLFLSPGAVTQDTPPRPLEPKAQRAALGLASALVVSFGLAPDALSVVVPFTGAPASTFPSVFLQLGLLSAVALVFGLWVRSRSAHFHAPEDRGPGYPPAHEAK